MSDTNLTTADPDEPLSDLEEAFLLYRDAGLRLPPVPRELADALEEQAEWQYATAPAELTDRAGFLARAAKPDTAPEVAFGHTGHGVASWFLCYQLIRGPLAVFVRQHFGSSYEDEGDEEIALSIANGAMMVIEEMVVAADAAREAGRIGPEQRLLVILDDVEESGWQVLGTGGTAWTPSDEPLREAGRFLGGR